MVARTISLAGDQSAYALPVALGVNFG